MILVHVPAAMRCDHDGEGGCNALVPVELALLSLGGFAFRPPPTAGDWQVAATPGGVFRTLCPTHRATVQTAKLQVGPAGPRIRLSTEH